jgi:hypothetical protein
MSIMTLFARHVSFICLLGFACLIVNTEVRAQSHQEARKRAFAELLARKAKAAHAVESRREIAAARHHTARQTADATSSRQLTAVLQRVEGSAAGYYPVSPVVPSGFGIGRDTFVDALYPAILGRNPTQSEEDYWSGIQASGVSHNVVATLIWDSPEHRAELQTHTSPGVPYHIAYRYALFIGKQYALGRQ